MEYEQNFGEKKNFLKNLIFQIYKGASQPSMLEETIINQTIVEYYAAYFHPFKGFTDEEREKMKDALLLQDKTNGKYEEYEQKMEERYGEEFNLELTENRELSEKDKRRVPKLKAIIDDSAATEGEKEQAKKALQRLTPEVIENNYLMRIERKLEKVECQTKKGKIHLGHTSCCPSFCHSVQFLIDLDNLLENRIRFLCDVISLLLIDDGRFLIFDKAVYLFRHLFFRMEFCLKQGLKNLFADFSSCHFHFSLLRLLCSVGNADVRNLDIVFNGIFPFFDGVW